MSPPKWERTRGVAMLAGLVMLASLSLLALVATSSMMLQMRMSSNFHDQQQSLQRANEATRWARAWLFSRPGSEREKDCVNECI